MTKNDALMWGLTGALIAGLAGYWFIGGDYAEHSTLRNALVVVQLLVGLWMMVRVTRKQTRT